MRTCQTSDEYLSSDNVTIRISVVESNTVRPSSSLSYPSTITTRNVVVYTGVSDVFIEYVKRMNGTKEFVLKRINQSINQS